MSGVITAIGVAATVASTAYSISQRGAKASATPALSELSGASQNSQAARTLMLETAGGSAGEQLSPGQVGGNKNNTFGN